MPFRQQPMAKSQFATFLANRVQAAKAQAMVNRTRNF